MNQMDKHYAMKKLVELGIVIPGIFDGTVGNITYIPISIEEFVKRIENEDIEDLSYNTRTMGRGIFTFDENGKLINYKGVDSKLKVSDSIAVASTEGKIECINGKESYGINVIRFTDTRLGQESQNRLEFRIKGASPYQDLLFEKAMRDYIAKKDRHRLVKLPKISLPTALSKEMCERFDLPRVIETSEDFMKNIDVKSYAGDCLSKMRENGISFETRNQLWREYFSQYHPDKLGDEQLMKVVDREDSTYELGATFGQTSRELENPFRIMELQYYLRRNDIEALNAILEYSSKTQEHKDVLSNYADVASKNAAGFMNLKLAFNNFEHRQDYPISGEICDDAFDDISDSLYKVSPSREDVFKRMQYYSQIYIFATNMKIIEDAYKLTGKEIPSNYKKHFVETFYDSLEDKANFKLCFQNENPMSDISHFNNAEKNFNGMELYMQDIRQIAFEVYNEKNVRNVSSTRQKEQEQNYPDKC